MHVTPSDKSRIKKILVISLSNIGDVILTFPVIDILKTELPAAALSLVIGPKAQSLFNGNPYLDKVYIYHKKQSPLDILPWIWKLRKQRFDLVVDLRNTAIPLMIAPQFRTPLWTAKSETLHMKEKHLKRLGTVFPNTSRLDRSYALFIPPIEVQYVRRLIGDEMGHDQKYVVVAPGAADRAKRWIEEGFAEVCDQLVGSEHLKVVFVGDEQDQKVAARIAEKMSEPSVNLCGRVSLIQLAEVLKHCHLAIGNDSAPMHLASYLDRPVLTIFGPTDPRKYGPWSTKAAFIQGRADCRACRDPDHIKDHDCIRSVTGSDVLKAIKFTPDGVEFVSGIRKSNEEEF
ncbi:MAG TPA: hypothetical protein DD723_06515 [Candidatus Omnitrophica bacterium]|nr:hypothetical protein [Candidatus Omnitrophota bacterium]